MTRTLVGRVRLSCPSWETEAMLQLARLLERLVLALSRAFGLLVVPIVVSLPVINVLGRTFDIPELTDIEDAQVLVFFSLVMLPIGYTYLRDGHVRIDVWRERTAPRLIAAIEIVGVLGIVVPLCSIMIWIGGESAWDALLLGERMSESGKWPIKWLVRACVPLGFGLLLAAGLAVSIRNCVFLSTGAGGPSPVGDDRPIQRP